MSESCSNCRYQIDQEHSPPRCRRFPPLLTALVPSGASFPMVQSRDWCGEWKPDADTQSEIHAEAMEIMLGPKPPLEGPPIAPRVPAPTLWDRLKEKRKS